MGPLSFDSGDDGNVKVVAAVTLRFNGAAVFRQRRRRQSPRTGDGTPPASMGPLSFDSGDFSGLPETSRQLPRFNGAAVFRQRRRGDRVAE